MDNVDKRLYRIRDQVERMSVSEQHKVYNMLCLQNCQMNENNNGVFVNLSTMDTSALDDLERAINAFQNPAEPVMDFKVPYTKSTGCHDKTTLDISDGIEATSLDFRKKPVSSKSQTIMKRIMKQSTRRFVSSVKVADREKLDPEEEAETEVLVVDDLEEEATMDQEEEITDDLDPTIFECDEDCHVDMDHNDDQDNSDNMSEDPGEDDTFRDLDQSWRDNDLYTVNVKGSVATVIDHLMRCCHAEKIPVLCLSELEPEL
ncbi:hypothetical protein HK102_012043 [Quaeritorhiza haematococci]|nr:hypothetical protein HK102_012043 [Quaeritorhiza haematococci]